MTESAADKILVIEDDAVMREIVAEILSGAGFDPILCVNGEEALKVFSVARPSLILSDVRLPTISGFEVLRSVREHSAGTHMPFIIVSAKAATADIRMGMALGADDYVTKPFEPNDLIKTIRARLARSRAQVGLINEQNRFLTHTLPHELRTPLTGVIGYAVLMVALGQSGEGLSAEDVLSYGRDLQQSGNRLLELVERLALWARLQELLSRGSEFAERPSFRVGNLQVHDMLKSLAQSYGREADLFVALEDEPVKLPLMELPAILRQLVDNALKFSMPGDRVEVLGMALEKEYRLTIVDRGRGMTQAQIDGISAFRQFDRLYWEQQGVGLGLAIARSFAEASGGSLSLRRNHPVKGVTVEMTLPRYL